MAEDRHTRADNEGGSTKCPNEAKCRLLALPAELRLQIYEYAVLKSRPVIITRRETKAGRKAQLIQPALSKTCRSIREDALKIYYSKTRFAATYSSWGDRGRKDWRRNASTINRWLRCIGAKNRGLINSLEVFGYCIREFNNPHEIWYIAAHRKLMHRELGEVAQLGGEFKPGAKGMFLVCFPSCDEDSVASVDDHLREGS
ncbi:hypothetical protein LTR97_006949 [Elasticomyces elasticus]|uniref:2EXR domain-containing protein n=1 Tax=Elasticomyces elasticus TaxID=574655 RepID=A0AAN7VRF2_9PEZI|nr:hypothetical protein LTR97_006949 [Elasticomyces elasticus]